VCEEGLCVGGVLEGSGGGEAAEAAVGVEV